MPQVVHPERRLWSRTPHDLRVRHLGAEVKRAVASPRALGYRRRARLHYAREGDRLILGFRDMAYVAGLTASDRSADIKGQTKQILDRIDGYLA